MAPGSEQQANAIRVDSEEFGASYWDDVLHSRTEADPLDAWQCYMDRVYRRLFNEWLPPPLRQRGLKTDLFEEAVSCYPLLTSMGPQSIGIDCSPAVVRAAEQRLAGQRQQCTMMVGDLRRLPIRSASREYVLCTSSLDHFARYEEIATCLAELNRVLIPGGFAIFTFDNPHNPVVRLRNHLPFAWLKRVGLVPYYVGRTYTKQMAIKELHAAGFQVLKFATVAHAPRAAAIGVIALLERLGCNSVAGSTRKLLEAFEWLQYLPTRYQTGYYIAIYARKCREACPDKPGGWLVT
jgi:ubiquinone/menaquinone biosynthesis C-methylase UbiE